MYVACGNLDSFQLNMCCNFVFTVREVTFSKKIENNIFEAGVNGY